MSIKVLLVDDEEKIGELLSKRLSGRGCQVRVARGGEEALEIAESDPEIAVATLDVRMPGMDGIELLHRLREKRPDVEVVMLSAHGAPICQMECRRWGARAFLNKPADIEELAGAIEEAAKARSARLARQEKMAQAS